VEFRILGPLEVISSSGPVDVGGPRQQTVLATLLLGAGAVISADRLLEAIYGENLPPTCRSQLRISISSLRHLFASKGRMATISTQAKGYTLQIDRERLDSWRFEEIASAARNARAAGQLDRAVASYRDALRLWRGHALSGIESDLLQAAASRLDEERIATNEDRLALELDLGRHHELVGELTELVSEFPLREVLRGQLMLALYRSDRKADALAVYRTGRRIMIDELGIEPGVRLRELEHAILTSDPLISLPADPVWIRARNRTPSLLPSDIADFTGRTRQLEEICTSLLPAGAQMRHGLNVAHGSVPVVVIAGKPGIGKTSVAVRASHSLTEQFPDGRLFADMHGTAAQPVSPAQVLERFLRVLGMPGSHIPDGLDERAEAYRDMLAERRVLIVLDDVRTEQQVLPLLPGSSATGVIITSRSRLAGLAGAIHVELDVFDAADSLALLDAIAGSERVRLQPGAAAAVAELCGHLPLALRIAGARLSARPHWSIQHLVERLADETRRLDELRHGDMGVRAFISLTYDGVSDHAQRLFRRLAILDLPAFAGWVSAALLDEPASGAEDVLEDLVSAQLVEATGTGADMDSQYRFHDLIGVFARERLAAEESQAERKAALERVLGALLCLAEAAHRKLYGGDYVRLHSNPARWQLPDSLMEQLVVDPLSWFERERAALVSGVRQASKAGLVELCWNLALTAVTLFESRLYTDDWRETHMVALAATRRSGHRRGEAALLYSLGSLSITQQKFDLARQDFTAALSLFESARDAQGIALVIRHLAFIDRLTGRLDEAAVGYRRALATFRDTGDQAAAAHALHGLAQVKLEQGQLAEAREVLDEALRLSQASGTARVEAQVWHRLGELHLRCGDLVQSHEAFERALARVVDMSDSVGEAYALQGLGIVQARQGDAIGGKDRLRHARVLASVAGDKLASARILLSLSEAALIAGDPEEAVRHGQAAVDLFREMGAPLYEQRALSQLRFIQVRTTRPHRARNADSFILSTSVACTGQVHHHFNRYQERLRETPAHRHAEFGSGPIQDQR
jgi:DNA-binding SARP family transcriptional activator/tetratricopeptide (TPR) repeat protein